MKHILRLQTWIVAIGIYIGLAATATAQTTYTLPQNCTTCATSPTITALNCASATFSPATLTAGTAYTGTVTVPYTGGNGAAYTAGTGIASTGVTGLTATLQAGTLATGAGNLIFAVSGTPSAAGTASFALGFGGQSCTLTRTVATAFNPSGITAGTGTLTGNTCFDIAESNNNVNGCGDLTSRATMRANFNQTVTNTQTYTFTPSGTVSNVRFYYINSNGAVIQSITGGNSGDNITATVSATALFNTALSSPNPASPTTATALGTTGSNPLTGDIYVVYNVNAVNSGLSTDDRVLKLTAQVKDCSCCGAMSHTNGVPGATLTFLTFQCHNLGANTASAWNTYVVGNADGTGGTLGYLYQWGRPGDGHQLRNSPNTNTLATTNTPNHNQFILNTAAPLDWRSGGGNNTRWGDGTLNMVQPKAANDPCPTGWKVPSIKQWRSIFKGHGSSGTLSSTATANTWTWTGNGYMVGQNLYLPAAGFRYGDGNGVVSVGITGHYWSSDFYVLPTQPNSEMLTFNQTDVTTGGTGGHERVLGHSVRCVVE